MAKERIYAMTSLFITNPTPFFPFVLLADLVERGMDWFRWADAVSGAWLTSPRTLDLLRRGEFSIQPTADQLDGLWGLASNVTLNADGSFTSQPVTKELIAQAAEFSGDRNPVHIETPHPLFEGLIAHGMLSVSMGLAAVWRAIGNQDLVPAEISIRFKAPVMADRHRIHGVITARGDGADGYVIKLFARDAAGHDTLATEMMITLKRGDWSQQDWKRLVFVYWQFSASLASTWPLCLYGGQTLFTGELPDSDNPLTGWVQSVEVIGKRVRVDTVASGIQGEAVIFPYSG